MVFIGILVFGEREDEEEEVKEDIAEACKNFLDEIEDLTGDKPIGVKVLFAPEEEDEEKEEEEENNKSWRDEEWLEEIDTNPVPPATTEPPKWVKDEIEEAIREDEEEAFSTFAEVLEEIRGIKPDRINVRYPNGNLVEARKG